MTLKHGMLVLQVALVGMLGALPASATSLMVGLQPSNGVTMLVKRFPVAARTTILGAQFQNNDARTVFPEVLLVRGASRSVGEGTVLARVTNVGESAAGIVQVTWPQPIVADASEDYFVAVRIPAGTGKQGPGNGPAMGAVDVAKPNGSYVAASTDDELVSIGVDLSLGLVVVGVGKTNAGRPDEPGNTSAARTFLMGSPNPFNPSTTVEFGVSTTSDVMLTLYDIAGHQVRTLVREQLGPGTYQRLWDGREERGNPVAAGIYVVRLKVGEKSFQEKIVLVK